MKKAQKRNQIPQQKKRKCQDSELKREAKEVWDTVITFGFVGHAVSASLFGAPNFQQYASNFPDKTLKTVSEVYPFLNACGAFDYL